MPRIRDMKDDQPLLVGKLEMRPGSQVTKPCLALDVWCPYCKRLHNHGWGDPPFRLDSAEHRVAHCHRPPFEDRGYYVAPDPSHQEHNRGEVKRMKEWLDKHEAGWISRYEAARAVVNEGPLGGITSNTTAGD